MKNLALFLVLSLLLLSCRSSFRISVMQPASIDLPQEVMTIGLLNNVTTKNSPDEVMATILSGEPFNGNVVASKKTIEGAMRSIEQVHNGLQAKQMELIIPRLEDGSVNWEELQKVADSTGVEAFLEFEKIKTVAPIGGSVLANVQGRTSTRIDGTATINIYTPAVQMIVEDYTIRTSYRIPVSGNISLVAIFSDLLQRKRYYEGVGFDLGYVAAEQLFPNWIWVSRTYYNKGNMYLRRAKPMIREGNWDIAEKQLNYGIGNSNRRKTGRIYYNLALVKEGQGHLQEAIDLAEKAALEFGNKSANDYLRKLRRRQVENDLLRRQQNN